MREQLRGRNLSHIGCFSGIVVGLTGGIILAGFLATRNITLGLVLLAWFALVVVLAAIGYAVGNAMSDPASRAPQE